MAGPSSMFDGYIKTMEGVYMYISIYTICIVILIIVVIVMAAAVFIIQKMRERIINEKLSSYSFVLSGIIEYGRLIDPNERIDWMIKHLEMHDDDTIRRLTRAACVLSGLRMAFDRLKDCRQFTILDVGGEYVRYLGVETAGYGSDIANNLAKCALSVLIKEKDISVAVDSVAGIIMNDEQYVINGEMILTAPEFSQQLRTAQLIVEKAIVKNYRDRLKIKFLNGPAFLKC